MNNATKKPITPPARVELRYATVWPSMIPGNRKLVLTIPNRTCHGSTTVMSHESLSVMRSWALANNYQLDTSRLNQPKKVAYQPNDDSDYTY